MTATAERTEKIRGTRPELGHLVKSFWAQARSVECEPLTFKDLDVGEMFIKMPLPGDNNGQGGLLGGSHLFKKTLEPTNSGDNALRIIDQATISFPDSAWVIKISY